MTGLISSGGRITGVDTEGGPHPRHRLVVGADRQALGSGLGALPHLAGSRHPAGSATSPERCSWLFGFGT